MLPSALRWQNDTEQNALVLTHLSWSADVSATIGRDHVVDLVVGNRCPHTVHFNFVVVANDASLVRPTINYMSARPPAVISFECRVEALMPFIVAHPVVSFLRCRAYTKKHGDRAAQKGDAISFWNVHSITSSASARIVGGVSRLGDLAVLRLMTKSNFVGCWARNSAGFATFKILSTKYAERR